MRAIMCSVVRCTFGIFATAALRNLSLKARTSGSLRLRRLSNASQPRTQKSAGSVYLVDEDGERTVPESKVNEYAARTATCGELRREHVGVKVIVCGWLEYQRMGKFLVLRDGYGQVQCIINDDAEDFQKKLEEMTYETVVRVEGTVTGRPSDMVNPKQATGEIEVVISKMDVLNAAVEHLPFHVRKFQKAKESLRMKYRYLDVRFPEMQRNLRTRSEMIMKMREFLVRERAFIEVETPTLFKATPGGAQEFVVPTRFPDQFYSLVQSPQQFKQMLMAGGIDRYFQVARCYRDETSRPDRQPEFTQLDVEMSFTDAENVMRLAEELLRHCWPDFLKQPPAKFPRMSYRQALESYGTDKPDTRYEFRLRNCTDILKNNNLLKQDKPFHASSLVFEDGHTQITKAIKDKLTFNQFPGSYLVVTKIKGVDEFVRKLEKVCNRDTAERLHRELELKEGCLLFLAYGDKMSTLKRLGKIREDYVGYLEENGHCIKEDTMNFLWIVDFPLFEEGDKSGVPASVHHPFTAPFPEDVHLLDTSPFQVRAQSYDLVLNGNEIAGGSIRIHERRLQERVLDALKIDKKRLHHMLEMLDSGCPPHGGIAFGLDRLLSTILKTPSIRDVIAFPKTFEGRDPLSGAPSFISNEDRKLYHLK